MEPIADISGQSLVLKGDFVVAKLADLYEGLPETTGRLTGNGAVTVDCAGITRLDTAGAMILSQLEDRFAGSCRLIGLSADHQSLVDTAAGTLGIKPPTPQAKPSWGIEFLARIGGGVAGAGQELIDLTGFVGLVVARAAQATVQPARVRLTAFIYHMETVGLNAVPIVCLISFLTGIVLAYQGAFQLRQFGAEIFVVDLLALAVLREMAVLLTAIIVAGRSGSAFTAEIGAMKVNEEVDAMRTLGLDPIEVLVLPRLFALIITLPLLTFLADMAGLFGGALMSWIELGITPAEFLARLNEAADMWHFGTGMIKAPVFAAIIAIIGCMEGLRVEGSAESVGRLTTKSVVEAIFIVIVADGLFSVFFAMIGI